MGKAGNGASVSETPATVSPPVIETVAAIEFLVSPRIPLLLLADYVSQIKSDFLEVQEYPELPPGMNPADGVMGFQETEINVAFGPPVGLRFWLVNSPPNILVQIQKDRIIVNWRRISAEDEYPGFDKVARILEDYFTRFVRFCRHHSLIVSSTVVECSYVNAISRDQTGWSAEQLFLPKLDGLPGGEAYFQFSTARELRNDSDHTVLSISGNPISHPSIPDPTFGVNISARTSINENNQEYPRREMEQAHDVAGGAFNQLIGGGAA